MGKKVLGVCLGAQLIADALGAKPEYSPEKEVGVFPIELTEEAQNDPLFKDFSRSVNVTHWHNDMPGLPSGSVLLAKSEGCPRQVIRFSPGVYGFQCHFEITRDVAHGLIENCPGDLNLSRFVQNARQILESDFSSINDTMKTILDRISVK